MSVCKGSLVPELTGATTAHLLAVVRWVAGLHGRAAVVSDHTQTAPYVELLSRQAHSCASHGLTYLTEPELLQQQPGSCQNRATWHGKIWGKML